ncbi:glycerophosphodiester phosphodiesterase family protein [Ekhidna sp.]
MYKYFLLLLLSLLSCNYKKNELTLDIQGHRGARGLAPENSIPGFILATELGVTTLEFDLVVSKDKRLIVSHEPFFSPHFCFDSTENEIPEDSVINIYQLTYDQIQKFDCGSKGNDRFPDQELMTTNKPLLNHVIDSVESYVSSKKLHSMRYNIELKTTKSTDSIFHPSPAEFSDLVYEFLLNKDILEKVTIQSFDFRTIQYFHRKYPEVKLALLIENELSWNENIDSLGFNPEIYSCYYQLLSQKSIKEIQEAGMEVIPWTINEAADMQQLISWGVDGIITDYPNRALDLIK